MKKTLVKVLIFAALVFVMSALAFANIYEPNNDGLYEVTLDLEPNNEYVLFAIKGEYDLVNYLDAFYSAQSEDIIYFEQKTVSEGEIATFGPFAPIGYYDATLIITGTNLEEPLLAGYLSSDGASNYAKIEIGGISEKYTVEGGYSDSIVLNITTNIYDSFGYESFTMETPKLSLLEAKDGVKLDRETATLTIDNNAKEQLFAVVATIGETTATRYVEIARTTPVSSRIAFYDDAECENEVDEIIVAGNSGKYPEITIYTKSFDQFGDETDDSYVFTYDNETATNVVKPTRAGDALFVASSKKSSATNNINIKALSYEKNSLELYNLIEKCQDELNKIGSEKFVCDENGKSVFAPAMWTTTAKKTAFENALKTAKTALDTYNQTNDAVFADHVTTLKNAYNTYISSFKTGVRKDVNRIYFREESHLFGVSTSWNEIDVLTEPRIGTTTDKLTFESSDTSIAEVDANGRVKAVGNGTAIITVTTRGGLTATAEVTCYRKVTKIEFDSNEKYVAEHGKPYTVVGAEISPNAQNRRYGDIIEWSLENPLLAELVIEETEKGEAATIIPKKAGKTKIVITAVNSDIKKTAELEVIMPDWETVSSPVANVNGNVPINTLITLTSDTVGSVIYYTLDGTMPSSTNGKVYSAPIPLVKDLTVKAIATKNEMYDSELSVFEYNALETSVSVTNTVAMAGEKVKLEVSFKDFVDIKNASVQISYDSESLALSNVIFAEGLAIGQEEIQAGKYVIDVAMTQGQTFDGVAVTLEFDVSATCADGIYSVVVEKAEAVDVSDKPRNVETKNGNVTVRDYILGDANDDGKIGLEDVLIIKQYTAGNANATRNILSVAADVNRDGVVDNNDASRIAQYCVGLIKTFN